VSRLPPSSPTSHPIPDSLKSAAAGVFTHVHFGKVRNSVVTAEGERILHTTDRISAFDVILPFEVPGKAEVLQALSVWFFQSTAHIVPNHFVGTLDKTHILAREAQVLPFEFVVRGVLTGSLWRLYEAHGPKGVAETYGIALPEGLAKNAALEKPLLTPTTKADSGHDAPITPVAMRCVLAKTLLTRAEKTGETLAPADAAQRAEALLADAEAKALALFALGRSIANERGLILVDTKYEFGTVGETLVLVDEVHTPDSSRYWLAADAESEAPRQLSKEFLREELMVHFGNPDNFGPGLALHPKFREPGFTEALSSSISRRYQEMFALFLPGKTPEEVCQPTLVPWPVSPASLAKVEAALRLPEKIMVVGGGGRDWTLQTFFAQHPEVVEVTCAPGKRAWAHPKYVEFPQTDVHALARHARDEGIGLVLSGPEQALCEGLHAACREVGVPCLGPDLAGAALEASKVLCKEVIRAAGLPTAASDTYGWRELEQRIARRANGDELALRLPCAVKYDGLAAGKGVFICRTPADLNDALVSLRAQVPAWEKAAFALPVPSATKTAGEAQFLVEDLLAGEELSVFALCNGTDFRLLPIARDYKRRDDGQTGPNTGGMGSICPLAIPDALEVQVKHIFTATLQALAARGTPYSGFLFPGLMIDAAGKAWVLEYNCRLGDPETQSTVAGLSRDFAIEILRTAKGEPFLFPERSGTPFSHDGRKRVYVVGASPEYPEKSAPRRRFVGLSSQELPEGVMLVPTAVEPDGTTCGGRAFGYLATADSIPTARARALEAMRGAALLDTGSGARVAPHFRTDIAGEIT